MKSGRQRMSAAERRQQLLDAARAAFIQNGFSGTRTKDICMAAGVSEAMLYQHFKSKQEIFELAVLERLSELVTELATVAARFGDSSDGRNRRAMSYSLHEHVLAGMLEITPLLGVTLFSDRDAGAEFYETRMRPLLERATRSIEEGLRQWTHPDVDPAIMTAIIFGTYSWLSLQAAFGGDRFEIPVVARELTDLLARGLSSRG